MEIKSECPNCHQPIRYAKHNAGQSVHCPQCGELIVLRPPAGDSPSHQNNIETVLEEIGNHYLWACMIVGVITVVILFVLLLNAGPSGGIGPPEVFGGIIAAVVCIAQAFVFKILVRALAETIRLLRSINTKL